MGYAEKNLAPGESILYRARYHWVFYRFSIVVLFLAAVLGFFALRARSVQEGEQTASWVAWLALAFAVIGLVTFVARRIRANMDEFVVTNRRVIRKVGLIAREVQHAPLEKIQDITIEQGIMGRMLGYGTVIVETASEKGMLIFPAVASPESFRTHVWGQGPLTGQPASAVPASPAPPTPRTRLEELESLKQKGLLSQEEYAAKRQEILSHL
jgi:membrane protein YdbS with pleckstrin-like domain